MEEFHYRLLLALLMVKEVGAVSYGGQTCRCTNFRVGEGCDKINLRYFSLEPCRNSRCTTFDDKASVVVTDIFLIKLFIIKRKFKLTFVADWRQLVIFEVVTFEFVLGIASVPLWFCRYEKPENSKKSFLK